MRALNTLVVACAIAAAFAPRVAGQKPADTPVDFTADAEVTTALAKATTVVKIHIDSYTSDRDRNVLVSALRMNGYQNFLPAFKRSPIVGYVQIKDQKWDLRWAAQTTEGGKQVVTAATDKPMFFLGGGDVDPKTRRGYEMAVIRLDLDSTGKGTGVLNAAARVKPNADMTNVIVDDYADAPVKLTTVTRQK
ncbi:MAG TPA: hypothetical protein VH497_10005 [Vicinamibacterales bacterium]|jgi:hypothetical protein